MKIHVSGKGWETWNFSLRLRGPTVPEGTYEVEQITASGTRRPVVVLKNPDAVGARSTELIGEDEEHLHRAIEQDGSILDLIA